MTAPGRVSPKLGGNAKIARLELELAEARAVLRMITGIDEEDGLWWTHPEAEFEKGGPSYDVVRKAHADRGDR